jgi:hypothetical protein
MQTFAESVIAVIQWVIVVILFQITSAVALKAISAVVKVKKQLKLLWVFSQLFSLKEMFRCLYPLMISAFLQKNVAVTQKTPATLSEKSVSQLMNSSRQAQTIALANQALNPITIAVANEEKSEWIFTHSLLIIYQK